MVKDEMDCSECGGPATRVEGDCSKCSGEIELDWIENVVGRRRFFWGGKFWGWIEGEINVAVENFVFERITTKSKKGFVNDDKR